MKTDTFTKVTLAIIAISLFFIAFKPILHPSPAVASPSYKIDNIQYFGTGMYRNKNVIVLFDSRTGQVWAYGINVEGEPSYLGKLTELGKPMVE